jgi:hypothetical protein
MQFLKITFYTAYRRLIDVALSPMYDGGSSGSKGKLQQSILKLAAVANARAAMLVGDGHSSVAVTGR